LEQVIKSVIGILFMLLNRFGACDHACCWDHVNVVDQIGSSDHGVLRIMLKLSILMDPVGACNNADASNHACECDHRNAGDHIDTLGPICACDNVSACDHARACDYVGAGDHVGAGGQVVMVVLFIMLEQVITIVLVLM
jgi:hypothetical protein